MRIAADRAPAANRQGVKMNIGSLGDIVFETSGSKLLTPNSVKCSFESRYEDHQIQGWYEQSEFLAPSLGTVSLAIHLRRDFLGESPLNTIKKLQTMQRRGQIVRLTLRNANYGRFTVRKIDYDWKGVVKNEFGPFSADVNVELKEYYD